MIIWYIHIYIYIYFYSSSKMMFEMVCFFSNETFQHQMFGRKSRFSPKSLWGSDSQKPGHGSTSRGRPETGRDRWTTHVWQKKWRVNSCGCGSSVCLVALFFSFSRSRMPTIWKSLLALQLAALLRHASHASHASTLHASKKRFIWVKCFWNMPTIWKKKGRYVRYVNAKDAKDAWISEMRAMSPHSWHAFACFLLALLQDFTSSHPLPMSGLHGFRGTWLTPWQGMRFRWISSLSQMCCFF